MNKLHHYKSTINWLGNRGTGTSGYKDYDRNHTISMDGKVTIPGSSDPAFRGDKSRYSPEDLLVSSLSTCHMLWYLHLCSANGVVVTEYVDDVTGTMRENDDGSGEFVEVTLHPKVVVSNDSMIDKANALHHEANKMCFIARSVNFPVHHKPVALVAVTK